MNHRVMTYLTDRIRKGNVEHGQALVLAALAAHTALDHGEYPTSRDLSYIEQEIGDSEGSPPCPLEKAPAIDAA